MFHALGGPPSHRILFSEDLKQKLRSIAQSDAPSSEESILPDSKSTILY
jgi:hypothetical protein